MRAGVRAFDDVRLRWALILALLITPLAIIRAAPAQGATLPSGFIDELVTRVAQPTGLTFTPDGRMLVMEKAGKVLVFRDSAFLGVAIDLTAQMCSEWERGLEGIAVDPDFGQGTNRTIYLYYTHNKKGVCPLFDDPDRLPISEFPANRVSKFHLNDNNTITPASEVVLVDNIPSPGIHNAGHLAFGPLDKLLYISVGDGGCTYPGLEQCESGTLTNARRTDILLGKILRINRDGTFPASNPYAGDADVRRCGNPAGVPSGTGRCGEIFATGLRNPFRFTFQPGTQNFYINDVGINTWEEIDKGAVGADYGFNVREGHCRRSSASDCQTADGSTVSGLTNPIFDYSHNTECTSITGGAFVPQGLWDAPYSGSYLFGDFVCGKIFRLAPKSGGGFTMVPFAEGAGFNSVVHLEFGPFGDTKALYYVTFEEGGIHRVSNRSAADTAPTAAFTATPKSSTSAPLTVTFNGGASTDPDNDDLDFHWDFDDGTTVRTEGPTIAHTFTREGAFEVSLVVEDDARLSVSATQLIEVGDPPSASILSPPADARFNISELVTLSGTGTDPDETLDNSKFSWTVIRHHNNTHTHPFLGPIPGKTLKFHYPEPEDLDAAKDSKLEAILTVTDSTGISRKLSRDLLPEKVQITIQDNRSTKLQLFANDLMYMGQGTFSSWPGYRIQLHATSPQQFSDRYYRFRSWSDGGAQTHEIITPAANATFTASFDRISGTAPAPPPPPPPPPAPTGVAGIARTPTGLGYWLASETGKVQALGNAAHFGDASNVSLNKPIVGMASTPSGNGYWLVATDGGVFSYGDARFHGSTGGRVLNKPVVGMAATPTGNGYWLVATDGGVFSFGDARFHGSTGDRILNKPVVGMDATPTGNGYWLVAADGGIFAFGGAPFKGSTGGRVLNKPIVAMDSTPSGDGYWLMATDGGVFAFPDAGYHGSTGAFPPAAMGVGIAATPDGRGYWLAFLDSTVAAFGNAPYF